MKKGYTDGPFGQIHWRELPSEGPSTASDLFCFHPAPFSGIAFSTIAPFLNRNRRIVSPDYPGYGGSDPFQGEPSIDAYADAMIAVIEDRAGSQPIDVLGFHTGCLVASELCRRLPERLQKACLIDVPASPAENRPELLSKLGSPFEIGPALDCLIGPWESGVVRRLESGPIDRAFEMFVEQIRPGKNMNAAFRAAFSYPWEIRFPEIQTTTMVLASQSGLLEGSRKAAEIIKPARLVERLDINRSVLDEAAHSTAAEVTQFLDKS